MTLRLRLRSGCAAALVGAVLLTAACSAATPGTPVAAGAASTSARPATSTASSPAAASLPSPATPPSAPTTTQAEVSTVTVTSSSTETVTEPAQPAETTQTPEPDPVVTEPPADTVDPVTQVWAQTMCTQMGQFLAVSLAVPGLDGSEPVDFRSEWSTYYATMADTVIAGTGEMAALDPPAITDGQRLHDGFLAYLKDLGLVAGQGSIDVAEAPDDESAQVVVQYIQGEMEELANGEYGLAGFDGGELSAVITQVPECQSLGS